MLIVSRKCPSRYSARKASDLSLTLNFPTVFNKLPFRRPMLKLSLFAFLMMLCLGLKVGNPSAPNATAQVLYYDQIANLTRSQMQVWIYKRAIVALEQSYVNAHKSLFPRWISHACIHKANAMRRVHWINVTQAIAYCNQNVQPQEFYVIKHCPVSSLIPIQNP
jgi:hypothetical protein